MACSPVSVCLRLWLEGVISCIFSRQNWVSQIGFFLLALITLAQLIFFGEHVLFLLALMTRVSNVVGQMRHEKHKNFSVESE